MVDEKEHCVIPEEGGNDRLTVMLNGEEVGQVVVDSILSSELGRVHLPIDAQYGVEVTRTCRGPECRRAVVNSTLCLPCSLLCCMRLTLATC